MSKSVVLARGTFRAEISKLDLEMPNLEAKVVFRTMRLKLTAHQPRKSFDQPLLRENQGIARRAMNSVARFKVQFFVSESRHGRSGFTSLTAS